MQELILSSSTRVLHSPPKAASIIIQAKLIEIRHHFLSNYVLKFGDLDLITQRSFFESRETVLDFAELDDDCFSRIQPFLVDVGFPVFSCDVSADAQLFVSLYVWPLALSKARQPETSTSFPCFLNLIQELLDDTLNIQSQEQINELWQFARMYQPTSEIWNATDCAERRRIDAECTATLKGWNRTRSFCEDEGAQDYFRQPLQCDLVDICHYPFLHFVELPFHIARWRFEHGVNTRISDLRSRFVEHERKWRAGFKCCLHPNFLLPE